MRSGYCQQAESMWTGRATSIVLHSMLHQSVCPVSVPAPFIPWPLMSRPPPPGQRPCSCTYTVILSPHVVTLLHHTVTCTPHAQTNLTVNVF